MKISHPVYGSSKMNNLQYWVMGIHQGIYQVRSNFVNWWDLMTNNYEEYFSFEDETEEETCRLSFWGELNEQVYGKEFLEELYQIMEGVESGRIEVFTMDENFWEEIDENYSMKQESFENLMNIFQEDSLDE
jgi:hypothetical protein